jgi:alpha-tubulin suppressor-like RCC1 family protein
MKLKLLSVLPVLFLLSGCGTLMINIDLGEVPPAAGSDTPFAVTGTATEVSTATPSPSGGESTDTPQRTEPTPVTLYPVALAAGRNFTCAVMSNGGVKCWGNNEHGQLGNGLRVNNNHPVSVSGLTDVKEITAGWGHVCALTGGGAVKCWGDNANGELGNGKNVDSNKPVDVQGLASGVVAIDSGDDHTCAVLSSGGLKCWGINTYGQLADWTKISRSVPVDSPWFGGGVADVAAGRGHTCVRTTAGWAKCWGNNEYGQMGFGKLTDIHLPAEDVVGLSAKILDVTADGGQTCALIAGGGAYCWGNNRYGQLGDGTTQKQYAPVAVAGLRAGVIRLEAGWNHTCAVVGGGELRCWGWNYFGQLGEGTTLNRNTPARVQYLTDGAKEIALGWGHSCVLTGLDMVKCWGLNESGQLGDGTWIDSKVPLTVLDLTFEASPTKTPNPTRTATRAPTVAASFVFVSLSAGRYHTCGVTSSGGVMCWGDNAFGKLGDSTKTDRTVPVDVVGLPDVAIAVAAGGEHTCALTASGEVSCWGKNEFGQLGDGTTINRNTPVDLAKPIST